MHYALERIYVHTSACIEKLVRSLLKGNYKGLNLRRSFLQLLQGNEWKKPHQILINGYPDIAFWKFYAI